MIEEMTKTPKDKGAAPTAPDVYTTEDVHGRTIKLDDAAVRSLFGKYSAAQRWAKNQSSPGPKPSCTCGECPVCKSRLRVQRYAERQKMKKSAK